MWNARFVLIATPEDDFITLYTKKEDPSLQLVADFMAGKFKTIEESRSLPVAAMLGKHLVSYLCAEAYGSLDHYAAFPILQEGFRPRHSQFQARGTTFQPMWSQGRDLWIGYCFSEDKAHRLGFAAADQCRALKVLYCNPVATRHHRCSLPGVEILSLFELLASVPISIQRKYEAHVRILQNHLHNFEPTRDHPSEHLWEAINSGAAVSEPIKLSYAREALGILKMESHDACDLAYVLAASNLLNAWINQTHKESRKTVPKEAYSFKVYTAKALRDAVANGFPEPEIFCEEDLTYVRLFGIQFSFHNLPVGDVKEMLASSGKHHPQAWSGVRLQPIANTVLDWARKKRQERIGE